MRKLITLLILLFSTISLTHPDDTQPPKLKEGFRDLNFGAKLSEINGLSIDRNIRDYVTYKRATDVLKLGKTSLDSIRYWFWDDKLAAVNLEAKTKLGSLSSHDIEEFFISIYGQPTQIKRVDASGTAQEIWEDDKTCIIYTIQIKTSPFPYGEVTTSVFIKSKEIDSERMKNISKSPNGL